VGIERGELLVPVGTLYIVYISSVYVVINVTNFKEGIKALILKPLYLMNRRVSYW
jgi:hypothetical protein